MKVLIKNVRIICESSSFNGSILDVLIENGKLSNIQKGISGEFDIVVDKKGLSAVLGLTDIGTRLGEPGFEYLEDANSLSNAASRGGYTHVFVMPNTDPVIDTAAVVDSVKQLSNGAVEILPIGALSKGLKGKQLAEMLDMNAHGVQFFSDGDAPIAHGGLLLKALEYTSSVEATVLSKSFDTYLSKNGQVHESLQSTVMGLTAIPSIAEEIGVSRDLNVLKYAGGKLHIHNVSSKAGVELIKSAKAEGLNVTCDVSAAHLLYNEGSVKDYDTTFKINPPLRAVEDQEALLKGLNDGVIDSVVSGHRPHIIDAKQCEFDQAEFGMSLIETAIPALIEKGVSLEVLAKANEKARAIAGLTGKIEIGEKADLTFIGEQELTYTATSKKSKGVNNPHIGHKFAQGVVGTVLGDNYHLNE